ncbi:uncharacterized protein HMPREF1541_07584 [Cyphellophora europaea CBS 101466]|uniref:Clr5 domain-containing protein n=1 Tax=Cyphellophora europaea (strain CBS 101466) TaxID=1220924 RepID=W2RN88_CYPE1|nr:uncharacterized protein HMPREF1541_07584 [Cyphellophora europaea CBS 101466]ETN37961.1 hypothetical protein HMPREF1541_07584 [Cyphellophora europaea CBS 101466]
MYKTKITAWSLDKNIKRSEAQTLMRLKRKHESHGVSCMFLLRGFLVDMDAVERKYKRRKHEPGASSRHAQSDDDGLCQVSQVHCLRYSCRFDRVEDPTVFKLVQRVLYHAACGLERFITPPSLDNDDLYLQSDNAGLYTVSLAVARFQAGDNVKGGMYLRRSFRLLTNMFAKWAGYYSLDLRGLFDTVSRLVRDGYSDLARVLSKYVSRLADVYLPSTSPYRLVMQNLAPLVDVCDSVPLNDLWRSAARRTLSNQLDEVQTDRWWIEYCNLACSPTFDGQAWISGIERTPGIKACQVQSALYWALEEGFRRRQWTLVRDLGWRFVKLDQVRALARNVFLQAYVSMLLAYAEAQLGQHYAALSAIEMAYMLADGRKFLEVLALCSNQCPEVLPWLESLSPSCNDEVQWVQTQLRLYEKELETSDREQIQESTTELGLC